MATTKPKAKVPQGAEWTTQEAADLREFLNTYTGQLFLRMLYASRPSIANLEDPKKPVTNESTALNAAAAHGWELCLREARKMSEGSMAAPQSLTDPDFVTF